MMLSRYATRMTLFGVRNMDNRKPYRTTAQKARARAHTNTVKGTHYSGSPRSFHPETPFNPSSAEMRHYTDFRAACAG